MKLSYKNIYFLGIGGIGMSGLARYFSHLASFVGGYDLSKTKLTDNLEKEGITVIFSEAITAIPSEIIANPTDTLIIYTPAIPETHEQYKFFIKNNYKILKRAEVLGLLSQTHKTIGIAGTHGKTTISAICSHIFYENKKLNFAFVGGIMKNYNSNILIGEQSEDNYLILEADEFDKSFHNFDVELSLISATEADHLDIYKTEGELLKAFEQYANQTKEQIILNEKVSIKQNNKTNLTYGLGLTNDFYANNIRIKNNKQIFDIIYNGYTLEDVVISMPGKVNIENALAAFSLAFVSGIDAEDIKKSLENFAGIERRFELIEASKQHTIISDYAHHPTEIERLYEAVSDLYAQKKVTAIFQPHLYTRTRDFADGFAKALSNFDEIILTDIYPAREKPLKNINSDIILNKIQNCNKKLLKKEEIINYLSTNRTELILIIGAGDIIDIIEPLRTSLMNKG